MQIKAKRRGKSRASLRRYIAPCDLLTKREANVLILYQFYSKSYKDIRKVLLDEDGKRISLHAIDNALCRALRKLKDITGLDIFLN